MDPHCDDCLWMESVIDTSWKALEQVVLVGSLYCLWMEHWTIEGFGTCGVGRVFVVFGVFCGDCLSRQCALRFCFFLFGWAFWLGVFG